jgi:hypothetical protein
MAHVSISHKPADHEKVAALAMFPANEGDAWDTSSLVSRGKGRNSGGNWRRYQISAAGIPARMWGGQTFEGEKSVDSLQRRGGSFL